MKSRELTNALIKLLGVLVCVPAIVNCLGGILILFSQSSVQRPDAISMQIIFSLVGGSIQSVLGIIIIVARRKIAGWMLKEDEQL
jgi:Na+/melibiose symporter-like transporter